MRANLVLVTIFFTGICLSFASTIEQKRQTINIKGSGLGIKTQDISPFVGVIPDMNFGTFPLYFITNKGQVNKKAMFYAKASRYTLWLTKEGLVFDSIRGQGEKATLPHSPHPTQSSTIHRNVSRLFFLNANTNPEIVPVKKTTHRINYFIGNDKSKWHCDVLTSQAVLYKKLYKNIDLKIYGIEKEIEYDWIVKPGGNPHDIRFQYKNVKSTRLDEEGNLLIETDFSEFIHKRPVVYQFIDNEKIKVEAKFKKNNISENTYQFEVGGYDKNCELIIDPVILVYSTYLGGSDEDYGRGIAVDSSGYVYVTGSTYSTDFPTLNHYQMDQKVLDVFVTKIDPTQNGTSSLIYSTYLGGNGADWGNGITVDSKGNVYVAGSTYSTTFPVLNQYQGNQSNQDGFVTKLDTTQKGISSLIYSTYLGGNSVDECNGVAIDSSGYIYVAGTTQSTDFPTLNPYQIDPGDGYSDVFVTKLDTTQTGGSSLIYSTLLGGHSVDKCKGIAVDSSGNAYVTGLTHSTDFPTLNPYQTSLGYGDYSAFVTRLDTTRTGVSCLIYSTYLGGKNGDVGNGIAVDNSGNAYVTGYTYSTDFPIMNPYQVYPGDDSSNAFVIKIDTTKTGASSLTYSTYLGGESIDHANGIAVDTSGYVYVTGYTGSTDFPILDQYQTYQGGNKDAFVTKIDTTRNGVSSIIYSTYLGGRGSDDGGGIIVDSSGYVYVTGTTSSTDFPTLNPFQATYQGTYSDTFVTKLITSTIFLPTVTTTAVSSITATSASISGNVTSDGGAVVTARGVCWSTSPNPTISNHSTNDGTGMGAFTSSLTGLTPGTTYYVRAYATNAAGTAYGNEVTFTTSPLTIFVSITNPQDGAGVSGDVIIKAEASSSELVTKVEFSIDGALVKEDTRAPYQYRWETTHFSNGNHTIAARAYDSSGQTAQHEITVAVNNSTSPPHIELGRDRLNFGAIIGGPQTGSQTFSIGNSGGGSLNWTVSVSDNWIQAVPLGGTGNMMVTVSVDVTGLASGMHGGTIMIADPNADNSPASVNIYLEVKEPSENQPPFGVFSSPLNNSTVRSSIAVTGWVLDDIGIESVKIYREDSEGLIYVGDTLFVEGARPDIESEYPTYPFSYRGGWGYMMLTNFLPDGGNGTFKIHAIATDMGGHQVTLGTKTIICDNANAVKPFGAIDTPTQGGTASGSDYVNFGWALTPLPNTIPIDGSTLQVWVDGVSLGHPIYNQYREDIATLFPNYSNSNGAVGYFHLDTTLYGNGVHTIAWSAEDDAGNADGIGSRYFSILNSETTAASQKAAVFNVQPSMFNVNPGRTPVNDYPPVWIKTGYNPNAEPFVIYPDDEGIITIEIKELERLEIHLFEPTLNVEPRTLNTSWLPIGSTLDRERGVFCWQPGPGFIGDYCFVFIRKEQNGEISQINLNVRINPIFVKPGTGESQH